MKTLLRDWWHWWKRGHYPVWIEDGHFCIGCFAQAVEPVRQAMLDIADAFGSAAQTVVEAYQAADVHIDWCRSTGRYQDPDCSCPCPCDLGRPEDCLRTSAGHLFYFEADDPWYEPYAESCPPEHGDEEAA